MLLLFIPSVQKRRVFRAYEHFYNNNSPILSHYLKEMLRLFLKEENLFQFNGEKLSLNPGNSHGNEEGITLPLSKQECRAKAVNSQQYGNVLSMMFSAYGTLTDKQGNNFQPTIRLTAEISAKETSFPDTVVYKRKQFQKEAFLDISQRRRYRATSPPRGGSLPYIGYIGMCGGIGYGF